MVEKKDRLYEKAACFVIEAPWRVAGKSIEHLLAARRIVPLKVTFAVSDEELPV